MFSRLTGPYKRRFIIATFLFYPVTVGIGFAIGTKLALLAGFGVDKDGFIFVGIVMSLIYCYLVFRTYVLLRRKSQKD